MVGEEMRLRAAATAVQPFVSARLEERQKLFDDRDVNCAWHINASRMTVRQFRLAQARAQ